jgi:hypothetical protein
LTIRGRTVWLRAVAAFVLLAVAVGVLIVDRARAELERHRSEILAAMGDFLGCTIQAQDLRASWWPTGVIAQGVKIPDESAYGPGDLAHADEVRLEVALLPLLHGQLVVDEVRIFDPVLRLVRGEGGGWNLAGRPASRGAPREEGSGLHHGPKVVVETVRVRNARVSYRDRRIPGVGEFELAAGNLRLRHRGGEFVIDFNSQALGGPEENLAGVLRIPDRRMPGDEASLDLRGRHLRADQLPDLLGLLRGELPIGLRLDGEVEGRLTARLPADVWPPTTAAIELTLDGRATSVEAASGLIRKPVGFPLDVAMALRAGGFGLAVDSARIGLGRAKLEATAEAAAPNQGQQPLALRLADVDAGVLGDTMPALALVRLTGNLSLRGTISPVGPGESAIDLHARLDGGALHPAGQTVKLGSAELQAAVVGGAGDLRATLATRDVDLGGLHFQNVGVSLAGRAATPLDLEVDASHGERGGAVLDRVRVDCLLLQDSLDVRSVTLSGLGGSAAMRGHVSRDGKGIVQVRLEPQWTHLDLRSVASLLGRDLPATGTTGGRATLAMAGSTLAAALASVRGQVDISLKDGSMTDLNLARATLRNLTEVPRLYEAVERRAEERMPRLLESSSRITELDVAGDFSEGKLRIRALRLTVPEYAVTASGEIAFDGTTQLEGSLDLSPEVSQSLAADGGVLSVLAEPGKPVSIPIAIRGEYPRLVSVPAPAFVSAAVRKAVGETAAEKAADFLRRLLGPRR